MQKSTATQTCCAQKTYQLFLMSLCLGLALAVGGLFLISAATSRAAPLAPGDSPALPPSQQVVTTPLDVVVVFDASGSMDYETNCFGCWQKDSISSTNIITYPYPTNGVFNPLPSPAASPLCTANPAPTSAGGFEYLVHEAELYSHDEPLQGWQFERHLPGNSYWAMQRQDGGSSGYPVLSTTNHSYLRAHPYVTYSQSGISYYPKLQGAAYNSECFSGPNLSGACWAARAALLGEPAPSNVPWVEYDFTPQWSGTTYIWIRAQGGYDNWTQEWNGRQPANNTGPNRTLYINYNKAIFWQVGTGNIQGGTFSSLQATDYTNRNGPIGANWRWLKFGPATTTSNVQFTLRLYQGSSSFMVDKIIFTNDPSGAIGTTVTYSGGGAPTANLAALFSQNSGRGPEATPGSATREACNACNPEFGLNVGPSQCSCKQSPTDTAVGTYPGGGTGLGCTLVSTNTNHLASDLFADQAPFRQEQEMAQALARQLDPQIDQLGLVAFSTNVRNTPAQRAKLQCLRWASLYGGAEGVAKCYDPATSPISFTRVIYQVENLDNEGATNLAEGLREGLEELGISAPLYNPGVDSACTSGLTDATSDDKHACDRGGAARKILILITDGAPNVNSGCPTNFRWNGSEGAGDRDYNCAMWYALQAALNNVTLFTVGLGPAPNPDLLTAMATGVDPTSGDYYFPSRCGRYFAAAQLTDLDLIVDQILTQARSCSPGGPWLELTKTGQPNPVSSGGRLTYTLTVANNFAVNPFFDLSGVIISDVLDSNVTFALASAGGVYSNGVVTWNMGLLPAGQSVSRTLVVTVGNLSSGSLLTNTAYTAWVTDTWSLSDQAMVTTTVINPGTEPSPEQIWALNYVIAQTGNLPVHLENHANLTGPYDIYLSDGNHTFKICSGINTSPVTNSGDFDCLISAGIPPGLYLLYSTRFGQTDLLAAAPQQVEVLARNSPALPTLYLPVIAKNK